MDRWADEVAAEQNKQNKDAMAAKPNLKEIDVVQLSTPFTLEEVKDMLEHKMKNIRDAKGGVCSLAQRPALRVLLTQTSEKKC